MNTPLYSNEKFEQMPVVGIIRNFTIEQVMGMMPSYIEAGFTTIEVTMNTPGAGQIIESLSDQYKGIVNIGAGTVCNLKDLEAAIESGAQFIVTPIVNEEVMKKCKQQDLPIFPGALTPTEIYGAWTMGATMVKVFPSASFGPGYIKELKGPFDQIKLMAVGGISIDNCMDFMNAGASGLGVGSQLFDKKMIQDKNWTALSAHFKSFANKLKPLQVER